MSIGKPIVPSQLPDATAFTEADFLIGNDQDAPSGQKTKRFGKSVLAALVKEVGDQHYTQAAQVQADLAQAVAGAAADAERKVRISSPLVFPYTFSADTTEGDPGNGFLRLDQTVPNQAGAKQIYLSVKDGTGLVGYMLDDLLNASAAVKGYVRIMHADDPDVWAFGEITRFETPIQGPGAYFRLTVFFNVLSDANPFNDGDPLMVAIIPRGEEGRPGQVLGSTYVQNTAFSSFASQISWDDTVPQIPAGTQVLSASFQIADPSHKVRGRFCAFVGVDDPDVVIAAVFRPDDSLDAIAATAVMAPVVGSIVAISLDFEDTPNPDPNGFGILTYAVRLGTADGSLMHLNGVATGRAFGGTARASLVLEEILP